MSTRNHKLCLNYQDHYELNMQNYFEVYIEVQNTSIDKYIVETDGNDSCVRDVEIQMQ